VRRAMISSLMQVLAALTTEVSAKSELMQRTSFPCFGVQGEG
jgi:hypothetical protein